jgi:hypothetical protein
MQEQQTVALTEKRQRIKDKALRTIFVRFQKEGIHKYPAAATDPALATGDEYDVSFLATLHRHIFHFEVTIEVFHTNRDIEFIQFKRWLEKQYSQNILALDYKSCEMMADDLYEVIATRYPDRNIIISVSEDNENGATISYNKTQPLTNLAI